MASSGKPSGDFERTGRAKAEWRAPGRRSMKRLSSSFKRNCPGGKQEADAGSEPYGDETAKRETADASRVRTGRRWEKSRRFPCFSPLPPQFARRRNAPERFPIKLEQFDGGDFSIRRGEHRSAMRTSREDFDVAGAEKTAKPVLSSHCYRRRTAIVGAWSFTPRTASRRANGVYAASPFASGRDAKSRRSNDST